MENREDREKTESLQRHRWFFAALWLFIILAIAGLWAIDYFYSPEMLGEQTPPAAAGK